MKKYHWYILLGLILIVMSATLFFLHYIIFEDTHHIYIYLLHDLAFVPVIEVLLVSLIIHSALSYREKRLMMKKLNMVIGAFYTEIGTDLLSKFLVLDRTESDDKMKISAKWVDGRFDELVSAIPASTYEPQTGPENFVELKELLVSRKGFLLMLLQNQNLLEQESFTNLLWAVLHLAEELENRPAFDGLPENDIIHLQNDIRRARNRLLVEWIKYMKHLKNRYPYLFSLAVRTNPFDSQASVVIQ